MIFSNWVMTNKYATVISKSQNLLENWTKRFWMEKILENDEGVPRMITLKFRGLEKLIKNIYQYGKLRDNIFKNWDNFFLDFLPLPSKKRVDFNFLVFYLLWRIADIRMLHFFCVYKYRDYYIRLLSLSSDKRLE